MIVCWVDWHLCNRWPLTPIKWLWLGWVAAVGNRWLWHPAPAAMCFFCCCCCGTKTLCWPGSWIALSFVDCFMLFSSFFNIFLSTALEKAALHIILSIIVIHHRCRHRFIQTDLDTHTYIDIYTEMQNYAHIIQAYIMSTYMHIHVHTYTCTITHAHITIHTYTTLPLSLLLPLSLPPPPTHTYTHTHTHTDLHLWCILCPYWRHKQASDNSFIH